MGRINLDNIERIARVLSSNCCENYFNCLIKYTQGKRIYYGQKNTWEVIQDFVVGLKSKSDEYTTDILLAAGGVETKVRRESLERLRKRKQQQSQSKEKPANKRRRKLYADLKVTRIEVQDDKNRRSSCHKSDKLPPTDSCKSEGKPRKRKRRCGNCGDVGHCAGDNCPEPMQKRKPKRVKGAPSVEECEAMLKGLAS